MGLQIAFWALAAILLCSAIYAISTKSVMRACFALIICFLSVSGLFITLGFEFLAVIQVMVYVGAVGVLIIMSVMMTKRNEEGNVSNKFKLPAVLASLCLAVLGVYAAISTNWSVTAGEASNPIDNVAAVFMATPGGILLMIIAALIVLTAIVAAITTAREE